MNENLIITRDIASFETIREEILGLIKHLNEINIVEFNSNISLNKQMRDAYPIYQLILSASFYKKDASPDNIIVINPFDDNMFILKEYHPKVLFAILAMINTDLDLDSSKRDRPCPIYLASQTSFDMDVQNGYSKYTLALIVTFCSAESFDSIPRAPISVHTVRDQMTRMFSGESSKNQTT